MEPKYLPTIRFTPREILILINALLLAEEAGIDARKMEIDALRNKLGNVK